jgi:hypothetical protein
MYIPVLSPVLGEIYYLFLKLDRILTRPVKLPKPVVSVGNIALGGRGKTPFVIEIVNKLKMESYEPVVLTRGYARKSRKSHVWLQPGSKKNFSGELCGDEALEIFYKTRVPVLVGPKRFQNALLFLRGLNPKRKIVFVLDDGFQHWSLSRIFDLVLVQEEDFQSSLLPLGYLREKPAALSRADLVFELGKDFSKKVFFKKSPPKDKPLVVLTTRAKDLDYKRFFEENFKNPFFLELRDHANSDAIRKALEDFPAETPICLGAKEATKIMSYVEFGHFLEEGFTKKLFAPLPGTQATLREFYLADFRLWMFQPDLLWSRLEPKLKEFFSG